MRVKRAPVSSQGNTVTLVQIAWYGRIKLRPVRQLPSGAKRASGMLMKPVWPVTLGSTAAAPSAQTTAAAAPTPLFMTHQKQRPRDRGLCVVPKSRYLLCDVALCEVPVLSPPPPAAAATPTTAPATTPAAAPKPTPPETPAAVPVAAPGAAPP